MKQRLKKKRRRRRPFWFDLNLTTTTMASSTPQLAVSGWRVRSVSSTI
jgi:hypothetical protein